MTLTQIHDRMDRLLENIRTKPDSEDFILQCETELDLLEQIREEMEEGV